MYSPKRFDVADVEEVSRFINANAFGQLVSQLDGHLFATHLPFLFQSDQARLRAHMAKANPQWQELDEQEVLVILAGPHAYVSPSWYSEAGVPTWNYQAVHIYGAASCFTDSDRLQDIVEDLTREHESQLEEPWAANYETSKLRGIVGIEIEIREIQCKYKLSQNRSDEERKEITRRLANSGHTSLARAMMGVKAED